MYVCISVCVCVCASVRVGESKIRHNSGTPWAILTKLGRRKDGIEGEGTRVGVGE